MMNFSVRPRTSQRSISAAAVIGITACIPLISACSRSGAKPVTDLTIADFADPELARTPAVASRPGTSASITAAQGLGASGVLTTGPFGASEGILDISAEVGVPPAATLLEDLDQPPPPPAAPRRGEELVEAKVGDVNNKPIFASDFLEPMGARLATEAARRKPDEWRRWARTEIRKELELQIEDELLRSEAYSKLKPEERQGLFSFLQSWQQSVVLGSGGSRENANQRLLTERGYDLDEAVRRRETEELIKLQLRQQVQNRVQVSRRDIELAYEKAYKTFNPDPKATLRWIHVPADKTEQIAEIKSALDSGEEFAVVAANPANEFKPRDGGLRDPQTLTEGEVSKTQFFAIAELNEAAQKLGEGKWSGPVNYTLGSGRPYVGWLYLEKVDRKEVSMYEVQLQLERYLRDVGEDKRRREYINELKARASYTNIDDMVNRLTSIAAERYGPGTGAARAAAQRAGRERDAAKTPGTEPEGQTGPAPRAP